MSVTPFSADGFLEDGFVGPLPILTPEECRRVATYLRRGAHPAPAEWEKGRAVHERIVYELAVQPALLSRVTALLGPDVVLWGASAVSRGPGETHPWHSDFESSAPDGRFVTAWIGLEHTSRASALQLISRSHRLGRTVQEVRQERGLRRELASAQELLRAAREHDPRAALIQPEMVDGEALLFDGRVWHGSLNRARGRRLALLLQYAAADCSVHIPDLQQLDWPPRLRAAPRPPSILVAGTEARGANRLVPAPPPPTKGLPMIATAIHRFHVPTRATKDWEMFPAFRGPTRTVEEMGCHVSLLRGGHQAHPPHAHAEEEFLLPLRGEVEVTLAASAHDPSPRKVRVGPGAFIYYAAGQFHTVGNPGSEAAAYLMLKWTAPATRRPGLLGSSVVQHGHRQAPADAGPFWTQVLLEGATANLGRFHSHLTVLAPGAGYEPHVDGYDVALITLEGTVETLGQRVEPHSVVYYAAGEPHGIRNVGAGPARYLAFEFHAPGVNLLAHEEPLARVAARRALGMGRRLVQPVWKRLQARAASWTGAGAP